jgi:hypothetical protein
MMTREDFTDYRRRRSEPGARMSRPAAGRTRRGQVLQCNRHALGVAAPAIQLFIWLTQTHTNRAASLEPAAQKTVRRAAANGQTADRLTVRGRRAEIKRCCAARPDPGPTSVPARGPSSAPGQRRVRYARTDASCLQPASRWSRFRCVGDAADAAVSRFVPEADRGQCGGTRRGVRWRQRRPADCRRRRTPASRASRSAC